MHAPKYSTRVVSFFFLARTLLAKTQDWCPHAYADADADANRVNTKRRGELKGNADRRTSHMAIADCDVSYLSSTSTSKYRKCLLWLARRSSERWL
jgi:hypothetical protein